MEAPMRKKTEVHNTPEKLHNSEVINEQELRENFFLTTVVEKTFEKFEDALFDYADLEDEEVQEWLDTLRNIDQEHASAFLATSHEMLETRIKYLTKEAKTRGIENVVKEEAEKVYSQGRRVAYHCSPALNRPYENKEGRMVWEIDGREPDHRDGDLPMAYYSLDLKNLYRKKNPNYIYIVVSDTGEGTTHKQDNHGAWGRATKLDVIDKIDFKKTLTDVENRLIEHKNKINNKQ